MVVGEKWKGNERVEMLKVCRVALCPILGQSPKAEPLDFISLATWFWSDKSK